MSVEHENELRKRKKQNFVLFCFVVGIAGAEYGFMVPTMYSYLKDVVRTPQLNLWFGLITCSYFASSILSSLIMTKYADRTRKIHRIIIGTCFFVSVGNIIYTVSYWEWLVLIGRFMQGLGDAVVPVLIGEITKTYTEEVSYSKLSTLVSIYFVTYISSPVIVAISTACDFRLFGIHFTAYNLPAYVISICWFSIGIVSYFIVNDSSTTAVVTLNNKDSYLSSNNINKRDSTSKKDSNELKMMSNQELFSCSQYRIVLLATGLHGYFSVAFFNIYLTMIAKQFYNLPTYWTSALFGICGLTIVGVLVLSSRYNIIYENEVNYLICGFCSIVISIQFLTQSVIFYKLKSMGEAFLAVFTITTGFTIAVEQVVMAGLIGKFIPQSTQAYAAGIRRSVNSIFFILGAIAGPLISEYMLVHGVVFSCIVYFFALYLIFKRQIFLRKTTTTIEK